MSEITENKTDQSQKQQKINFSLPQVQDSQKTTARSYSKDYPEYKVTGQDMQYYNRVSYNSHHKDHQSESYNCQCPMCTIPSPVLTKEQENLKIGITPKSPNQKQNFSQKDSKTPSSKQQKNNKKMDFYKPKAESSQQEKSVHISALKQNQHILRPQEDSPLCTIISKLQYPTRLKHGLKLNIPETLILSQGTFKVYAHTDLVTRQLKFLKQIYLNDIRKQMSQAKWDYMEFIDAILGTRQAKKYRKTKKVKRSILNYSPQKSVKKISKDPSNKKLNGDQHSSTKLQSQMQVKPDKQQEVEEETQPITFIDQVIVKSIYTQQMKLKNIPQQDFQYIQVLNHQEFLNLMSKRRTDTYWNQVQYIQNYINPMHQKTTFQTIEFVEEKEQNNEQYQRALLYIKCLNGEISSGNHEYITQEQEDYYEKHLLKEVGQKEYCKYMNFKIQHFVHTFSQIFIKTMKTHWIEDDIGEMYLIDVTDLQYIEHERPHITLENLKLKAQKRAEDRLNITLQQEEKFKKITNPIAVEKCYKEFDINYENTKKELGIEKEKPVVDQKLLSNQAFSELHPERNVKLTQVLDTNDPKKINKLYESCKVGKFYKQNKDTFLYVTFKSSAPSTKIFDRRKEFQDNLYSKRKNKYYSTRTQELNQISFKKNKRSISVGVEQNRQFVLNNSVEQFKSTKRPNQKLLFSDPTFLEQVTIQKPETIDVPHESPVKATKNQFNTPNSYVHKLNSTWYSSKPSRSRTISPISAQKTTYHNWASGLKSASSKKGQEQDRYNNNNINIQDFSFTAPYDQKLTQFNETLYNQNSQQKQYKTLYEMSKQKLIEQEEQNYEQQQQQQQQSKVKGSMYKTSVGFTQTQETQNNTINTINANISQHSQIVNGNENSSNKNNFYINQTLQDFPNNDPNMTMEEKYINICANNNKKYNISPTKYQKQNNNSSQAQNNLLSDGQIAKFLSQNENHINANSKYHPKNFHKRLYNMTLPFCLYKGDAIHL